MVLIYLALATVLVLLVALIYYYRRAVWASIVTFPTAVGLVSGLIRLTLYFKSSVRNDMTVAKLLEKNVRKHPDKIMFYFDNETWTYKQINELANKVANYFSSLGFEKGDVVGLLMENRPEHVAIWIGLSKIGVVSSIVNTNLRMESLRATLEVSNPKATIFDESTVRAVEGMLELGEWPRLLISLGPVKTPGAQDLLEELKKGNVSASQPVPSSPITTNDEIFYMYTSGSTGLPKAVAYKNSRFIVTSSAPHFIWGIQEHDILYTVLPLYHAAAGVTGVGVVLTVGASMVLRKKFSASRFWKDCVDNKVTAVQYIGEICRYLLRQPVRPEEREHGVKKFIGSGLRAEIWEEFVNRFKIPFVGELYGATESNCGLICYDGTPGAVGFIPRFIYPIYPAKIIKVDEITGEPIRDPRTGLGIICGPNEPGEWVGKIIRNHHLNDFHGYKNASSNSKVLRNIFKKGDEAYRSNDWMVMDELGYFRFKDRAALNYRWKGENISSVEVENTVSRLVGLKDVAAYGVKIPGSDGSAGMVTIADPDNSLDLGQLAAEVKKQLPPYAIPLFVRTSKAIETTGTHKIIKKVLQTEGFDVEKVTDSIYFYNKGTYVPLDNGLYSQIMSGNMGL